MRAPRGAFFFGDISLSEPGGCAMPADTGRQLRLPAFALEPIGLETCILNQRPPPMITEIAQIDVKPGTEKDFEAAVAKARPLFLRAKGGLGIELHKSIEKPSRYRLMAKWATVENHTVDFRGSEDFAAWRGLVGQYFAAPPEVEHTETVLS
jgi:heme-degrading monooxygenase HmoA